jgi:uncharacterized protein (DUF433 family)
MAQVDRRGNLDEQHLIERHVDLNTDRYPGGRADAWLRESGASVWAIVAFFDVYDGDLDKVAEHFDLSREEIEAALIYYQRNQRYIDARIILNEA